MAEVRPSSLGDGEKWIVRLDEPVGRFVDDDLRVSATQIEPIEASET
jgi:hypothetical protein